MLRRLRRKFIAITMLLVGLVLAAVLGSSLFSSALTQRGIVTQILERALEDGVAAATIGDTSGEQSADLMLAVVVDVSDGGTILDRTSFMANVPESTLRDVVGEALASDEASGKCSDHPIAWMKAQASWGWRIALVDTYLRGASLRSQALSSLMIFAISMGAIFAIAYVLSGWALRPVQRAWEQQRRFVSDASHELKTPLAVILADMQILESERGLAEGARRWVESASEEARHMKELVEDLLTLARADEQEATGQPDAAALESVDLTSLASGCALEFDAVAFERGCHVSCELAPDVVVAANPERLRRVARTLLDNATKYAEEGTEVRVLLARDGGRARLAVNNRGEVIAPDDLAHLFDRFYRTDDARERQRTGGFGLGLAIAKSLVEGMGGTIGATSDADAGTTFTVTLPLADRPSPSLPPRLP